MSVQGGNALEHGVIYAGVPSSAILIKHQISKVNKDSDILHFGVGVVRQGRDSMLRPTDATTAKDFIGVVKFENNRAYTDNQLIGVPEGRDGTVITAGEVGVVTVASVAAGDDVYLVVGDGTGTNQGKFSNAAGATSKTAIKIDGAKWVTNTLANKVGIISLVLGG